MTDTASQPGSRRWLMLPVVLLAMFMAGFDIWVVNVAALSLQRDLHVSDAALRLIVGGYAFMYASGMVTGGRLGDLLRVLITWQERQRFERRSWGSAYTDSGRFFTYEDGRALRPDYVSARFDLLIGRYAAIRRRFHAEGRTVEWIARRHRVPAEAVQIALAAPLPPVRFHDLRHGAATMLRAAKVEIKVISDILGHASTSFTDDVYTVVAEELAEQAAQAISAFVPRRARPAGS